MACQNDRLNLSFVKNIDVVSEKMARNGLKTAICQSQMLEKQSLIIGNDEKRKDEIDSMQKCCTVPNVMPTKVLSPS